jgi:hypothetical protein
MIGKTFTMITGIITGIYLDQSYSLPNIATMALFVFDWLKVLEENMRK